MNLKLICSEDPAIIGKEMDEKYKQNNFWA